MANLNLNGLINRIELNDLSSIQKVIQYFSLIPEVEKAQTVLRIRNALLKMRESVRISKSNPIYRYLGNTNNHNIMNPKTDVFVIAPNREDINYIDSLQSYFLANTSVGDGHNEEFAKITSPLFSKDILEVYNRPIYKKVVDDIRLNLKFKMIWYRFNNIIFNYCNKKIISLMKDAGEPVYQVEILNAYFLDLNEAIVNMEILNSSVIISSLHEMSEKIGYLPLEALGIYEMLNVLLSSEAVFIDGVDDVMKNIRSKISDSFLLEPSSIAIINKCANKNLFGIIPQSLHLKDSYIENILEERKIKSETGLNTIFNDILPTKRYRYHYNEIIEDGSFKWIHSSLEYFSKRNISRFLKALNNKLLKTRILDTQIYALKSAGIIQYFVYVPNQDVTLGISKKTCYVLASNMDKIYMFPIFNGNETDKIRRMELMIEPLICRVIEFKNNKAIDFISTDMMVIEATNKIEFDKDTNLRFNFKRSDRNTYMNRYSDIHTVLVQNSRNKNYEAMKTDLCRLYALIYIIERDVTYSMKAVSPSVKADGSKARMFAKNDLKRYLSEVTAHEKDFDLAKHFNESSIKNEIEKEYDIKINTLGIKKLIKSFI